MKLKLLSALVAFVGLFGTGFVNDNMAAKNYCELAGCTIEGEHGHSSCGVEGCLIEGEHTHSYCGVEGCYIEGAHTHERSGHHHGSGHGNGHH